MKQIEWTGIYSESWQGEIVPEAFSHPAKFSRALIRKIYQHMLGQGYVKPGDSIVDPFGGVGLGGLDAMRYGLHWRGVELEPRFVELGQQNIELWNGRYREWFKDWGTAVLVQGDSRNLTAMLGEAGGVVSSPPYIDAVNTKGNGIDLSKAKNENDRRDRSRDHSNVAIDMKYGRYPGQLGSMPAGSFDTVVSSPPYEPELIRRRDPGNHEHGQQGTMANGKHAFDEYGRSPGQLGSMPAGSFDSALSSPPYANTIESGEGPGARHDYVFHSADNATKSSSAAEYGRTEGQLGGMDAAVTSSPFESSGADDKRKQGGLKDISQLHDLNIYTYGSTSGNIGNDQGETFWSAARVIIDQLYQVLKPGAYAAFVCGDFVRKGERVYFGRQWLALCEAAGFEPVEWIVCWKREPGPTQVNFLGDDVDHSKDRVSFFRRLANQKNPDSAVLNEDVIIVRKPGK